MSAAGLATTEDQNNQLKQFREFLISYSKMTEICFTACVWDFKSRVVKSQEDRCAINCLEKYLKVNNRVGQRFQEYQLLANEKANSAGSKG